MLHVRKLRLKEVSLGSQSQQPKVPFQRPLFFDTMFVRSEEIGIRKLMH
jgi:hypothetical protein